MKLLDRIRNSFHRAVTIKPWLQGVNAHLLKEEVLLAYARFGTISRPTRCDCGALVRYIADHSARQWKCPLCGCALPYVFWKLRSDLTKVPECAEDFIIALGDHPCGDCGESLDRGLCRCKRVKLHAINEEITRLYQSDMSYETRRDKIVELTAEANEIQGKKVAHA
jgi:hypothetical protein